MGLWQFLVNVIKKKKTPEEKLMMMQVLKDNGVSDPKELIKVKKDFKIRERKTKLTWWDKCMIACFNVEPKLDTRSSDMNQSFYSDKNTIKNKAKGIFKNICKIKDRSESFTSRSGSNRSQSGSNTSIY